MNPQYILGKRIVVRGVTGSGKTTLARALAQALDLTHMELDAINWQTPGWQELEAEEFRRQIEEAMAAAPNGWVSDGNYTRPSRPLLEAADTLVWVHLPWRVSFYRVVKRTLQRWRRRELLWGAQREQLRDQLFSKDSLWWWSIRQHGRTNRRVLGVIAELPHVRVYELRSQGDVAALLEAARRTKVS